jgi:hypothetical protein
VGHHHHHHRITNHFFNSRTHAFGRVDPVRHTWTNSSRTTAFNSTATRSAASSIFNRSMQRTTFARGSQGITGKRASTFNGTQGRQGVVTNNHNNTVGRRTFNSSSFAGGSGMDHRSSRSSSRSFSAPPSGFSGIHASGGFSAGHSFGGFSGGHAGGGGRR